MFVLRNLATFIGAVGYAAEQINDLLAESDEAASDGKQRSIEDEILDEDDLRYLVDLFDRVNERVLDEIHGWEASNGVLLAAIFAVFVFLLDKIDTFTIWPILALVVPTTITAMNVRGHLRFSPDPRLFQSEFERDRQNALLNLINDQGRDVVSNSVLRNRKRSRFWRAFVTLILVCIVAATVKEYNLTHRDDTAQSSAARQGEKDGSTSGGPGWLFGPKAPGQL